MGSNLKNKTERSVRKKRSRKLFQMLLLLYLFIFTVSQLHSPTGASFNDVTNIEVTLMADNYFQNAGNSGVENVDEKEEVKQKETNMGNEPAGIVDAEQVDLVDEMIEEQSNVAKEEQSNNESTIFDHQDNVEKEVSKDQPAANQTDRSESDNENEDDVKLD